MADHSLPYPEDIAPFFANVAAHLPAPVWLDSAARGRYSIVAAAPRVTLVDEGGSVVVERADGRRSTPADGALSVLRRELQGRDPGGAAPFGGGAMGYFGYGLGRRLQGLPPEVNSHGPDLAVGLYDWAVVIDHGRRRCTLSGPGADAAIHREIRRLLAAPAPAVGAVRCGPVAVDLDAAGYATAFDRVRRYIRDGDCYQVNLSRAFRCGFEGDALAAYGRLRRLSAAPFGGFLRLGGLEVLSVSPERFLAVRRGHVETWPIKGTRPRAPGDVAADAALARELRASAKDRAENVMIVDLLRNDLGRVCQWGSIAVPGLCELESHATVHHLVSRITGRLRRQTDALDLLAAALPGGSITGAPKRRAMEIIDELECSPRGVYCGAIGYLGYDGDMDTNIAIRTAVRRDGELVYRAGGGLVWESTCDAELAETEVKAGAFLALAEMLR